ncbi:hypothetical protein I7I51_02785 [Histoplasma capsulatum]|uniref:Uncharacterized protein n=1 Tax=Ajellomyces capsulatus TaxID=5037 RepID=A0A8A1MJD4_AJECA|nr:hypothetical protein I7I51_02785 [Histoplasma capsulatum]
MIHLGIPNQRTLLEMAISSIVISLYATSASYHTNINKIYSLSEPAKPTKSLARGHQAPVKNHAHGPSGGILNNAKPRSIQKGQTEPERNHGRAVVTVPTCLPGLGVSKTGPAYIDEGREAVSIQRMWTWDECKAFSAVGLKLVGET